MGDVNDRINNCILGMAASPILPWAGPLSCQELLSSVSKERGHSFPTGISRCVAQKKAGEDYFRSFNQLERMRFLLNPKSPNSAKSALSKYFEGMEGTGVTIIGLYYLLPKAELDPQCKEYEIAARQMLIGAAALMIPVFGPGLALNMILPKKSFPVDEYSP